MMALRVVRLIDLEHKFLYPVVNFFEKDSMRVLKFKDLEELKPDSELAIELASSNKGRSNSFLVEVIIDFAGVMLDGTCIALCGKFCRKKADLKTLELTWDVYFESKDSNSFSIRKY